MNRPVYFNWKGAQGRETVDEARPQDFATFKDFRREVAKLCREYNLCGMAVYTSSRPCANWKGGAK